MVVVFAQRGVAETNRMHPLAGAAGAAIASAGRTREYATGKA
ncbi:hypothetical protein FHT08_001315 [Xanthomonas campestris]|nr:hypothetical protein [Xanthomonas sp. CFBP 8151]SOU01936.1 hypothetical protein CFBP6762_03102 [Xanthomonas arboricola pv. fragariae]